MTPELQVVLAHLVARAGPDGAIRVPVDVESSIERALDDHLRRALEHAFPTTDPGWRTRRARALLLLREMVAASGRLGKGLTPEDLEDAMGEEGSEILRKLSSPLARLVVLHTHRNDHRWAIAHDRMAEPITRLVAEEGCRGRLVIDKDLVALRQLVDLRSALFDSGELLGSTSLDPRRARLVERHADVLLWDGERRQWWSACRRRRRIERARSYAWTLLLLAIFVSIGKGSWHWALQRAEVRSLYEQVRQGEPKSALAAFDKLMTRPQTDAAELLEVLRQRDGPMDMLERGLGGLDEPHRSLATLNAVDLALAWISETPEDPVLIANLVWALDAAPSHHAVTADRAARLRDRVLDPLRRLRPPPPVPGSEDPDWVHVSAGNVVLGSDSDSPGEDDEQPPTEVVLSPFRLQRHEVTNREYRRLRPEHPGADELPVANVDWYAAYTYAAWLGGRLPTEAEWEYAARAGCRYSYCDRHGRPTTLDAVAWTQRNSRDPDSLELVAHPVMGLEPNPWGIYDMLGNVWEWTADWYTETYEGGLARDRWTAVSLDGRRVNRGGGFWDRKINTRAGNRAKNAPDFRFVLRGFRVVLPMPDENL
ncbi:MAG: formylglycine-generating enzyme family protein [Holophagales bacterium]|nr:formylglycine-generating enzyme family protein [Holophagales bacterium]